MPKRSIDAMRLPDTTKAILRGDLGRNCQARGYVADHHSWIVFFSRRSEETTHGVSMALGRSWRTTASFQLYLTAYVHAIDRASLDFARDWGGLNVPDPERCSIHHPARAMERDPDFMLGLDFKFPALRRLMEGTVFEASTAAEAEALSSSLAACFDENRILDEVDLFASAAHMADYVWAHNSNGRWAWDTLRVKTLLGAYLNDRTRMTKALAEMREDAPKMYESFTTGSCKHILDCSPAGAPLRDVELDRHEPPTNVTGP